MREENLKEEIQITSAKLLTQEQLVFICNYSGTAFESFFKQDLSQSIADSMYKQHPELSIDRRARMIDWLYYIC